MFKVTCLVAHKRIDRSHHIERLKSHKLLQLQSEITELWDTQQINMQQTCIMNA
jgi:hypothetical protein